MNVERFVAASTDTVKELVVLYVAVVLLAAVSFQVCEQLPFLDALWMTMVTATTTGYGDMYPKTIGGKITAVVLMHAAVFFIMPLVTARLSARLIVNNDAWTHDEQEDIKNTLADMRKYMETK